MYWDTVGILLVVFACVFFVLGLWAMASSEGFIGCLCWLITGLLVMFTFFNTAIHNSSVRDKTLKQQLIDAGWPVISVDPDSRRVIMQVGGCTRELGLYKSDDQWQIFRLPPSGTDFPNSPHLQPETMRAIGAACQP